MEITIGAEFAVRYGSSPATAVITGLYQKNGKTFIQWRDKAQLDSQYHDGVIDTPDEFKNRLLGDSVTSATI